MKNDNKMDSALYNALRSSGVKEKDAQAAAIEAAKSDIYFNSLEKSMIELRAHVDQSAMELRAYMVESQANIRVEAMQVANRQTWALVATLLGSVTIAVTVLVFVFERLINGL